ncbi:porin family protein [Massilia sp. Dwa41.01b]|uniref:porin family protein n=1 Tax=unclassified Massilia TaxID=2609279 RepID=UPI0016023DB0|nr:MULTISPECIES: porin family protein [unclassified Massilia]QNA90871.1 porin family protein [Massilia sp. Dwa41.01b]QNA98110.1 porin family protein [Massilia sp. Se16.2.3]
MKKLIFALIASTAVMTAAQAQSTTSPRAYVGVGVASADHDYRISGVDVDSDGYKASGKLFGGVELNQTFGVEAGYTDFRKSHANYSVNGVGGTVESEGYGTYLAGKATMPINEQASVYGKLGVTHTKAKLRENSLGLSGSESDNGVYAGVGVQYNLNQQVSLLAEYERYGKKKDFGAKPDVLTIGAKYSF